MTLTVTVCGGGNGAHCSAGYIASKGFRVNILTRKPEKWSDTLTITTATSSWASKGSFVGKLAVVSNDPADVIPDSDVVIVAAPAHVHGSILKGCAEYLKEGVFVGTIFAQGAFDWIATEALGSSMSKVKAIFGLQNIPWICKITEYGKEARILGPKDVLKVVSYPVEAVDEVASLMTRFYDIPSTTIPNFLSVTLTPSNQIIHPARYYSIFRDALERKAAANGGDDWGYTREELEASKSLELYKDFDPLSAEILACLDNELQTIKLGLTLHFPQLDLTLVPPIAQRICETYGDDVGDSSSLLQIMRTNKGYVGCGTPMTKASNGKFQPNTGCRLFWEDVPFGLCILKGLAEQLGNIPTPTINKMIFWHQEFMGKEYLREDGTLNPLLIMETGHPSRYGLHTVADIVAKSLPSAMMGWTGVADGSGKGIPSKL
mmetsp:Transcript_16200/g.32315  ORF Transcript_16200/g.32315 Transcript_16200/m.32315 type:complete len:433 (+) Transcript_16200:184-1482(+)|eukprot:CAMPEP_0197562796 /NCGR_PEP_ID=MMETSP1320-20131121/27517_1 /TAXON_ID=91990 /ORGANISM="Bolidomonas sp., Strain RCC2347" /LENGTH=432 /DNA_ID=CAMNT_0043124553 /DNA_START=134 /DNA_END=1432 /DNA_ORIENTATION=+